MKVIPIVAKPDGKWHAPFHPLHCLVEAEKKKIRKYRDFSKKIALLHLAAHKNAR
tara:strand:+ start:335 stop:499 length:165 start_codon:yes stop_codon:yes gene_type:complete